MRLARDTIITLGTKLPPALGIFGRLQARLRDPNAGMDDIVELIRVDPALTFQIIRLSNSVLYGLKSQCQSLEEAVARVGFAEIQQIVGLIVAKKSFQGELSLYQISAGRLWENAVACGSVMSALATRAGGDGGAAYATGLLRNIGLVVLNNYAGAVKYPGETEQPDLHAWEREVYGMTSADATALLLEHWRFSPDTVAAMRGHLAPEFAGAQAPAAARLHLAGAVAAEWGCSLPGETQIWRNDPPMHSTGGVSDEDWPVALEEARRQFARFSVIEWAA
ncbi:MAG TPA: HDOD domain-containing protein [Candidatus Didemnitutus sp.]|nr:HDOD domain-containing protein [Candidatus Didemnitutus sp.]